MLRGNPTDSSADRHGHGGGPKLVWLLGGTALAEKKYRQSDTQTQVLNAAIRKMLAQEFPKDGTVSVLDTFKMTQIREMHADSVHT